MTKCKNRCVKCDKNNLLYGILLTEPPTQEPEDNEVCVEYRCKECGHIGKEWYTLNYKESE